MQRKDTKIEVSVVVAPIHSMLGQLSVNLMSANCDRRITQESLDLYRGGWKISVDYISDKILMWAAIYNGEVVGMTACVVKNNKTYNSITVVDRRLRGRGIGTQLMTKKNTWLTDHSIHVETSVAEDNRASIGACLASGLKKISEVSGKNTKLIVMGI